MGEMNQNLIFFLKRSFQSVYLLAVKCIFTSMCTHINIFTYVCLLHVVTVFVFNKYNIV